jgi:hypothetical protein
MDKFTIMFGFKSKDYGDLELELLASEFSNCIIETIDEKIKLSKLDDGLVLCDVCRCMIRKEDAQQVPFDDFMFGHRYIFYCMAHKVNYSRINNMKYYRGVQVDGQGIPAGYISIQEAVNMKVIKAKKNKVGRPKKTNK